MVIACTVWLLVVRVPALEKVHEHKVTSNTHHRGKALPNAQRKRTMTSSRHRNNSARKLASRKSSHSSYPIRRPFVVSAELKPMARQLLEVRSPAAYESVEAYARRHRDTTEGALAWLVVGYARILDINYLMAVSALKQAEPQAGELADYCAYFLARSYAGTHDTGGVAATLRGFEVRFSHSLLLQEMAVLYATALLADGEPQQAIAVLERHGEPLRADVELSRGRSYLAIGSTAKGAEILRRVYLEMPLTPEAEVAGSTLRSLPLGSNPLGTIEERKLRADALLRGRRYGDAITEYMSLLSLADATERPGLQLALGAALRRAGRRMEAQRLLTSIPGLSEELNAQRIYELVEIARSSDNEYQVDQLISELRRSAPTSPWIGEALLTAANMHLLDGDYAKAAELYREIETVKDSPHDDYAHWRATWITLRQGHIEEAKRDLEAQIVRYPRSAEVPAALYWRARLAEEEHDWPTAQACYVKITDRFPGYYYGVLARVRLRQLDPLLLRASAQPSLLPEIPPVVLPVGLTRDAHLDEMRVRKAWLLESAGMTTFAARELKAAAPPGLTNSVLGRIADLYNDSSRYDLAIEALKHAIPDYLALHLSELPHFYWINLFPRPYWAELSMCSRTTGIDPYLLAALVRQESEFNPNAVSGADALGLMQLLPRTGKRLGRQLRIAASRRTILTPSTNLLMGATMFRELLDQYGGKPEYALAAYNAGSERVQLWQRDGHFRDTAEFVESIPFTETREYVQAIIRNAEVYRRLYGVPSSRSVISSAYSQLTPVPPTAH
jgi:soluble lytic murein transglycosylase